MSEIGYQRYEGPPEQPAAERKAQEWIESCPFSLTVVQMAKLWEWARDYEAEQRAEADCHGND